MLGIEHSYVIRQNIYLQGYFSLFKDRETSVKCHCWCKTTYVIEFVLLSSKVPNDSASSSERMEKCHVLAPWGNWNENKPSFIWINRDIMINWMCAQFKLVHKTNQFFRDIYIRVACQPTLRRLRMSRGNSQFKTHCRHHPLLMKVAYQRRSVFSQTCVDRCTKNTKTS